MTQTQNRSLVVVVTHGAEHELSSVALTIANGGITSGLNVSIFLTSAGVDLVRKRAVDLTTVAPLAPLATLIQDFVKRGGTIWACTPCVKARGYEQVDLIDGVTISGPSPMHEVAVLQTELSARHTFVAGQSTAMLQASRLAQKAAKSSASILLLGESGSGKEVLARLTHAQSLRAEGPSVAVNCATLSAELLHSELFGHERGAFTGATQSKVGRIEQAESGTLFLDEIGEFAVDLQATLLRAIQEREFERLGGTRTIKADVRILTATHRNLRQAIQDGSFREDLYYRLNVISIPVPPVRERQEDIPALLAHFLQRFAGEAGRPGLSLSTQAETQLLAYAWPGNVREVSNVMERAVVLAEGGTVELEDLPEEIAIGQCAGTELQSHHDVRLEDAAMGFHEAVAEAKRRILSQALERCDGHQTRASKLLGLTQPYMSRLLKTLAVRGESASCGVRVKSCSSLFARVEETRVFWR